MGYSLWGRRELDMTEQLSHPFTYFFYNDSSKLLLKYLFLCIYLAASGHSCHMWDLWLWLARSGSLIREQTQAPCIGMVES